MFKNAFALSLLLTACVDQDVPDVEIDATNKLAGNALLPDVFATANLNPARLTAANLQNMASTVSGRAVLPYIIGCALPAGTSVTTTYQSGLTQTSITFQGELGLATGWQSANLSTSQQRLVSACTLGRANKLGQSVQVSLRGPSTALAVSPSELANYTGFEGAFFGNVFNTADFRLVACRGTATTLPSGRTCAVEESSGVTECSYEYAGLCSETCATVVQASNHTYYKDCSIDGTSYAEVVNVNVQ